MAAPAGKASPRKTAALHGGLAVLVGFACAMPALLHDAFSWWYLGVAVLLLAPATAGVSVWTHLLPPKADRPGLELLAAVGLGAGSFCALHVALEAALGGRVSTWPVSLAVLGAGLALAGTACRLVIDRGGSALRAAVVVGLLAPAVVTLAFVNYHYATRALSFGDMQLAADETLQSARRLQRLVQEVGPLGLAVGLPSFALLLGWRVPAQVLVGLVGTVVLQRVLGWQGPYEQAGPNATLTHVELLAAVLVPLCSASAARLSRRPPTG